MVFPGVMCPSFPREMKCLAMSHGELTCGAWCVTELGDALSRLIFLTGEVSHYTDAFVGKSELCCCETGVKAAREAW